MPRIAVGDIMTKNFQSAKPLSNVYLCAKEMVKKSVSSLIVTENNRLLGILTYKDILWAITKKPGVNLKELRAIDIATKKVAVTKPSADINQALRKMRAVNFRRLPVLSKGELIGVVTLKDILKIDPSLYSEIGELSQIKEEEIKLAKIKAEWPSEGICDYCGAFSELLKVYDKLLCPDCREELH
jgi:CBS domain-containing protein